MNNKVILVLIDGLAWQVAHDCMGYLQGLREAGRASLYRMDCELPALSRPLYECVLTGVRPVDSGVVHNDVTRLSTEESIFHLARKAGATTAAAAYHWISELYNRSPYDAVRDRFTDDESLPIQHGVFYHADSYPDDHLFIDGEILRRRHDPDFLLIHPMNTDDAGHRHGLESSQYRNAARRADNFLSAHLPTWIEQGYQVLVTSDHGMNKDHTHRGVLPEERQVPLFIFGKHFSHDPGAAPRQLELCGVIAELLGVSHEKIWNKKLLAA
ncbi:MAG: alkaline phosphatase family protein [Polaromonas sp.]|uniref:alkaline phosphatase family protein n=1 Tax=Polaromonas sp. TaxID=1869339 RepID=UPI00273090BC|nr:alkaline phosphatase family protein [Polaromonas sp.]MDP2257191.1 alkaline phosphatase family protein [Polaromonas sp.]MDP3707824.1 alkaline phosphatase family protein [Polaromonas sp.]